MKFFDLPELTARLVMTYMVQCVLGIIMYSIFRYFSRIYIRRFLRSWARSWISFSVYTLSSAIIFLLPQYENSFIHTTLSLLAQLGCYLQIFLILVGTYQLIYEKPIKRKFYQFAVICCILLAFITVMAFNQDPEAISGRYLLRMGTRTFIPACGFLFAGIIVLLNQKFTSDFGQKLLACALVLYGLDQFAYFSIIIAFFFGYNVEVPSFFGSMDLLLISLMGLGQVMWLLENEREKLNKANKELDSFLYSTSHDLKAPIASILGLTYLGKAELEEERARIFMEMIEVRIRKLDLVVGDILTLARSKKFEIKIEEIDFNQLLEDTIVDVKFNKGAASISLIYEKNLQNVFMSDYHQMKVVLGNLISNAVKYHNVDQPKPYIKVTFNKIGNKIQVEVEDNGQGISPESLPKIFDMFYRSSKSTEGTGLGLYIVKAALDKIKGTISVTSELGKGTTFKILFDQTV